MSNDEVDNKPELVKELDLHVFNHEDPDAEPKVRHVTFNAYRYSWGLKKELVQRVTFNNFATISRKSLLGEDKAGKQLKKGSEEPEVQFEKLDVAGWKAALEEAKIQITKVLWGISDLDIYDINADEFEQLMATAMSIDPLNEEKNLKKKQQEAKMTQIQKAKQEGSNSLPKKKRN